MDGKFTLATLGHKESKRQRDKETVPQDLADLIPDSLERNVLPWSKEHERKEKCRVLSTSVCITIYVNNRGNKKTIQLYTKPYILLVTMLIFSVLRNVGFVHQTLHKPCTELYIELFTERCKNLAQNIAQTQHNPSCRSLKSPSL